MNGKFSVAIQIRKAMMKKIKAKNAVRMKHFKNLKLFVSME